MCTNSGFAYCIRLFFCLFSFVNFVSCWYGECFDLCQKASLLIEWKTLQLMDLSPLLKHSLTNIFPGTIWPCFSSLLFVHVNCLIFLFASYMTCYITQHLFHLCRFPYYYHFKFAFLVWLQLPSTEVSSKSCLYFHLCWGPGLKWRCWYVYFFWGFLYLRCCFSASSFLIAFVAFSYNPPSGSKAFLLFVVRIHQGFVSTLFSFRH